MGISAGPIFQRRTIHRVAVNSSFAHNCCEMLLLVWATRLYRLLRTVGGITRFDNRHEPAAPPCFLSSGLTTSAKPQARAWSKGARVGSARWNYTPTARVKVESATRGPKLRPATAWRRPSMHNRHAWPSKARRLSARKSLGVGNDEDLARRRISEDWIVRPGKAIW